MQTLRSVDEIQLLDALKHFIRNEVNEQVQQAKSEIEDLIEDAKSEMEEQLSEARSDLEYQLNDIPDEDRIKEIATSAGYDGGYDAAGERDPDIDLDDLINRACDSGIAEAVLRGLVVLADDGDDVDPMILLKNRPKPKWRRVLAWRPKRMSAHFLAGVREHIRRKKEGN